MSNVKIVTGKDWAGKVRTLVYAQDGAPVCTGDLLVSSENYIVTGGSAPHKPGSTGRVYVTSVGHPGAHEFFPGVFNLRWETD